MMKNIASKLVLGSVVLGSLVVMACSSDADIAKVQGNQNGSSSGASGSSGTSGTPTPTPTPTPTSPVAIDAGAPDSGGLCNGVAQEGTSATVTVKHLPAPSPQGGAIADGVYVITSDTLYDDTQLPGNYDNPTSVPRKYTLEIKGTAFRRNILEHHQNFTVLPGSTSTTLSIALVCDDETPGAPFPAKEWSYTATPTTYTEFYYSTGGGGDPMVDVTTWTKIR